jgi:heme exporter protein A
MAVESVLLTGEALTCLRGGRTIFTGVDLRLAAGQVTWLRGPNGCGKTSLLRLLAGLSRPEAGRIVHADPQRPPAYVGHSNALKDELRVHEALSFLCSVHGSEPDAARLRAALAPFRLEGRLQATVRKLSQGQRRKVALARLWLVDAPVWLLDEPYDALDRAGCESLDSAIGAHLAGGGAVILTSHQEVRLPGLATHDLGGGAVL